MDSNRTTETKYERLRKIGIGSYGVVFKCINRQTGQIVAIKRYSENDSDPIIRKIAMREVRMLRQLKHPNLIQLIEVFRRKRILHLVFDYCELTVLDVIEKYANNCPLNLIRKIIWQLVNGVSHCHSHNCIHRDIKPENILINQAGVVKLCDFGFARNLISNNTTSGGNRPTSNSLGQREAQLLGVLIPTNQTGASPGMKTGSGQLMAELQQSVGGTAATNKENKALLNDRQALTEYVATRWYRAPELLVGDIYYDIKIDIWAVGCVTAELMRGEPIWPGKTDLEQLCLIMSSLGQLTSEQTHNLLTRGLYEQSKIERALSQTDVLDPLDRKLPGRVGQLGVDFVLTCLQMDPAKRPTSDELLQHPYIRSALMGQFVRGASHGNPQVAGDSDGVRQKPIGRGMLPGQTVELQRTNRGSTLGSNSQAILRVANNQQPASKRLVLGPVDSSLADGSVGSGGSITTGSSHLMTSKIAGNSLVPVPVRNSNRKSATSGDERKFATKQSRHKRKVPHSQMLHKSLTGQLKPSQVKNEQLGAASSPVRQVAASKSRLLTNQSEPPEEMTTKQRLSHNKQPTTSRRARQVSPSGQANSLLSSSSSSFALPPTSSSFLLGTSRFSSSQTNLQQMAASGRRSSGSGSSLAGPLIPPTNLRLVTGRGIGAHAAPLPVGLTRRDRGQSSTKGMASSFQAHQRDGSDHAKGANKSLAGVANDNSASTNSTMSTASSNSLAQSTSSHQNKSYSSSFLPPVARQTTGPSQ